MHGNMCSCCRPHRAQNRNGSFEKFDGKIYLAVYSRQKELQQDLVQPDGVERLKRRVSREDLYYASTGVLNSPTATSPHVGGTKRSRDYLLTQGLLRAMAVVAGAGASRIGNAGIATCAEPILAFVGRDVRSGY